LINIEKIVRLQLQSNCIYFIYFSELLSTQQILLDIVQLQQEYIVRDTKFKVSKKSFFREKKFLILIFLENIVERHWISERKL